MPLLLVWRRTLIGRRKQASDWLFVAARNVQCEATPEIKLGLFVKERFRVFFLDIWPRKVPKMGNI